MSERSFGGSESMVEAIRGIVDVCFSPELRLRQAMLSEFQPELAPVKTGATITLGRCICRDEATTTFVDNVESIGHDASIGAGSTVGPYAYIGPRVTIAGGTEVGAAARIEHGSEVGSHARVESGAVLLTACGVGDEAIIGVGAEVGYDRQVAPKHKVLPGTLA